MANRKWFWGEDINAEERKLTCKERLDNAVEAARVRHADVKELRDLVEANPGLERLLMKVERGHLSW